MRYQIEVESRVRELRYPDSLVAFSSIGDYPRITEHRGVARSGGRTVFEGDWQESRSNAASEARQWARDNA